MTKKYDFFVFPFDKILLYLSFTVTSVIKDDWDWEYLVSFSYIKSQLSFDQKKKNPLWHMKPLNMIKTEGIFLPNATVACFRNCFIEQKNWFLDVFKSYGLLMIT